MNFYNDWGIFAVFLGGFTPIPYKIIALTSGYSQFNFIYFIFLSVLSRGLRFFIIAFLVGNFGPAMKTIIEKKLLKVSIVISIVLIVFAFLIYKFLQYFMS